EDVSGLLRRYRPGTLTRLRGQAARRALAAGEGKAVSRSGLLPERELRTRTGALIRSRIKAVAGGQGPTSRRLWMPRSGRACRLENTAAQRIAWNLFSYQSSVLSYQSSVSH